MIHFSGGDRIKTDAKVGAISGDTSPPGFPPKSLLQGQPSVQEQIKG
jgi:hypothetical protein